MPGLPNHDTSKSTITLSLPRLQVLVEEMAGTGHWRGANREVVDFGVTIGTFTDPRTGITAVTARGTIHYSKAGAHVVPTAPRRGS
jgi:hypothetical protein